MKGAWPRRALPRGREVPLNFCQQDREVSTMGRPKKAQSSTVKSGKEPAQCVSLVFS